jgi:hypothetical protein
MSTKTVILALYVPQKTASVTIGTSASSLEIIQDLGDVRQTGCTRVRAPVTARVLLRPALPSIRYVQLWCAENHRRQCHFVGENQATDCLRHGTA